MLCSREGSAQQPDQNGSRLVKAFFRRAVTHELISTMNCKQAQALMSAAVDGELTPKEREGFEKHIVKCPSCLSEFKEAQKTKSLIREKIVRFKAPQSLVNSVLKLTNSLF